MNPQDVVERYFASIRARDTAALTALYAEDATFVLPNGKAFSGAAAIGEMHGGVFAAGAPTPSPQRIVVDGNSVAVEIEALLPDGTVRHTANFYTIGGAGLIERLSVYMQGG